MSNKPFTIVASGGVSLAGLADSVHDKLKLATEKATYAIRDNSQANVPVRTGNAKNSMEVDLSGLETDCTGVVSYGGITTKAPAGAEYVVYIEYGTHNHAAHPFLTPAVEFVRGPYYRTCRNIVKNSMQGIP